MERGQKRFLPTTFNQTFSLSMRLNETTRNPAKKKEKLTTTNTLGTTTTIVIVIIIGLNSNK